MQHPTNTTWHAGRTTGRAIYRGDGPDDLIGVMDSRHLASFVVVACNAYPDLLLELQRRVDACPACDTVECADCCRSRAILATAR